MIHQKFELKMKRSVYKECGGASIGELVAIRFGLLVSITVTLLAGQVITQRAPPSSVFVAHGAAEDHTALYRINMNTSTMNADAVLILRYTSELVLNFR